MVSIIIIISQIKYHGTKNHCNTFNQQKRAHTGQNLISFSMAIFALNSSNGKYDWYIKFDPKNYGLIWGSFIIHKPSGHDMLFMGGCHLST